VTINVRTPDQQSEFEGYLHKVSKLIGPVREFIISNEYRYGLHSKLILIFKWCIVLDSELFDFEGGA